MAEDIEDVRRKIDAMHSRLDEQTYYELLAIDPSAVDQATVMKKFRSKAKRWHADRYSGLDLQPATRRKLQEIFSTLNTAQQTLSDADKRAEYDFKLQAGDQNIEHIIDAEGAFRRGKNMLETGSNSGAHRQFERACQLHPDEPEYRAHLLYTEYLQISKDDAGKPTDTSRAREIADELDAISEKKPQDDSVLTFLGVVLAGLGNQRQARGLFREALQHNRQNVVAKRQLRLLDMRAKRSESKGFLATLLDKFRS